MKALVAFVDGMVAVGDGSRNESNAQRVMRHLEPQGILCLPTDPKGQLLALGGILPSEDYMVLPQGLPELARMSRLTAHANALITKYHFLDEDPTRRLARAADGCVCIMFAEEQDGRDLIYVPFFGISGYSQVDAQTYLQHLGVPDPIAADTTPAPAGPHDRRRIESRFFALLQHYRERADLGLKVPAKQSILSYMQYLETPENRALSGQANPGDLMVNISKIVSWNSIQCAEPAAVMAAAHLYYRMSDMAFSVPFEGRDHQQKGATPQGKETCGRCAISERCFAGVVSRNRRKMVTVKNMHHMQEFRGAVENRKLIYNRSGRQAYPNSADMSSVLDRMRGLGLAQFSQQAFWTHNQAQPGAISARQVRTMTAQHVSFQECHDRVHTIERRLRFTPSSNAASLESNVERRRSLDPTAEALTDLQRRLA